MVKVDVENRNEHLYLVKYLKWDSSSMYPLGVVRGVISAGVDYSTSQRVLNLIHRLPMVSLIVSNLDTQGHVYRH